MSHSPKKKNLQTKLTTYGSIELGSLTITKANTKEVNESRKIGCTRFLTTTLKSVHISQTFTFIESCSKGMDYFEKV